MNIDKKKPTLDITGRILALEEIVSKITQGNLDLKISDDLTSGNDELFKLAKSFKTLIETQKQTKLFVNETIMELDDQRNELADFKKSLDESSIVAITDKEGTIIYVNDKFCKISKYSREELMGQNHRILKSGYHPDSFYTGMWKVISDGRVWHGDIKNKAKDSSFYWVRTTITPFTRKDGKPERYIAIRTDITSQKKNEEELAMALEETKKSDVLKEEFFSMITHELKTPLTPIIGHCGMLKESNLLGELNATQLKSVNDIERNSVRLEHLIEDILDAQKLDLGKMLFNKKSFQIDEFMKNMESDLSSLMKDKQIEFVSQNSINTTITSDENRIKQVMDNLVKNAVDFVPKKTGRIEIGAELENSEIVFHIKDNGIGIPKDKQHNLFKKFYQVDTSTKRKHGGTGLGLVICKGIVDGLGGDLWVESDEGKGTIFYFSIPIYHEKITMESLK